MQTEGRDESRPYDAFLTNEIPKTA
jgi:hypothetical protein